MAEEEQRYTGTMPALAGCAAGVLFAVAVAFPFLFVWAWSGSHCEPVPQCLRRSERALAGQLAVIIALAVLLGLAVRSIVRWHMQRRLDPRLARRPSWAIAVVCAVGLLFLLFMVTPGALWLM